MMVKPKRYDLLTVAAIVLVVAPIVAFILRNNAVWLPWSILALSMAALFGVMLFKKTRGEVKRRPWLFWAIYSAWSGLNFTEHLLKNPGGLFTALTGVVFGFGLLVLGFSLKTRAAQLNADTKSASNEV
jgi:predicted membrane channel-forming protein YqfA (hemolysin III family)